MIAIPHQTLGIHRDAVSQEPLDRCQALLVDGEVQRICRLSRQPAYISVGNFSADDRAALILMDYAGRGRLKIYAHVESLPMDADPDLAALVVMPGYKAKPERILLLHLVAFDWNCPQHITPRFTRTEIAEAVQPLRDQLASLEAENATLRAKAAAKEGAAAQVRAPQAQMEPGAACGEHDQVASMA